jgi:chromosome segregation ATPase
MNVAKININKAIKDHLIKLCSTTVAQDLIPINAQVGTLSSGLTNLEVVVDGCQQSLGVVNNSISAIESKVAGVGLEVKSLSNEVSDIESGMKVLKGQIEIFEESLMEDVIEWFYEVVYSEIVMLQKISPAIESSIKSITQQLENTTILITNLENKVTALEKSVPLYKIIYDNPPTPFHDQTKGYRLGSVVGFADKSTNIIRKVFVCLDVSVNQAVWVEIK